MSSPHDAADVVADTSNSTLRQTISESHTFYSEPSLLKIESSADPLTTLPPELGLMVLDVLVNIPCYEAWEPGPFRKRHRAFLSRTCMVCRTWCRSLRPKIFAHIRLSSSAEVRALLEILRGAMGEWLSAAVTDLEVLDDGSNWIDLERSCRLLAGRLPSLSNFGYNTLQKLYKDSSPTISLPSRGLLTRFTNLSMFSFVGVTFLSFSSLARILGELPNLDQVALHHVGWIHQESCSRPPARPMPSFRNLRYILADDVTPWPLILLWGPMLERRCIPSPGSSVVDNPDAKLLALLIKTCCESAPTARLAMKHEGDTIQIATWRAKPHWALNVKLWPSAHASTLGPCSIVRHVELRVMQSTFFVTTDHEIDWELVDDLFSQEAVKLEHFIIGIDLGGSMNNSLIQSLPTRFPRLCEQNKFNVQSAYWVPQADGFIPMS